MLDPTCGHDYTRYTRDLFYEAKLEISKITSPYLYK